MHNSFDTAKVVALKLDASQTSATANLTATVQGSDGLIHTVSTPISSTSTTPVAKTIVVNNDTTTGMHLSDSGNTIYIDTTAAMTTFKTHDLLQKFDTDQQQTGLGGIYFYALDSNGKKGLNLANIYVVETGTTGGADTIPDASKFAVVNGRTTMNHLANNGDYVVLTAVSKNGLVQTIKIVNNI